jgi:ribonuclease G
MEKFEKATKPTCLFEESDLIKRSIIQAIDKQYSRILIDDYNTFQRLQTTL